jgi:hypothetical protein
MSDSFRIVGAANDLIHRTERKARSLAEAQSLNTQEPVGIERLDGVTWRLIAVVEPQTWTFLGHWTDGSRIEVTKTIAGEHEDVRVDDGTYPGGLWAETGFGFDEAEVKARIIARYENPIHR